jgi:ABC-type amino acid transport substrate-binding protein
VSSNVKLGIDPTFPPFEYKDPSGNLAGFDVDLGRSMCKKIKWKCVFVENSFDRLIPALAARKFDAILPSLSLKKQISRLKFSRFN